MAEMSFLSSEVFVRDFVSPFDPSGLGAEESLGLLDDYLEVAKHFKPHGFSCDKAKAGSSEWLAVDGLVSFSDNSKGKRDFFISLRDLVIGAPTFDSSFFQLSMFSRGCFLRDRLDGGENGFEGV